jgi:16S rRNA A1518/A1519 N6-dimethyltransferase RsmA/KsgA/DIM1 with predicted DNA glycosylase/AP lyase activity
MGTKLIMELNLQGTELVLDLGGETGTLTTEIVDLTSAFICYYK